MAVYALIFATSALAPQAAPAEVSQISPFLYTVAREYESTAWIRGGERFPLGSTVFIKDGNGQRAMATGLVASADASVSFDAKNVLFSGKRTSHDRWQIWETSV